MSILTTPRGGPKMPNLLPGSGVGGVKWTTDPVFSLKGDGGCDSGERDSTSDVGNEVAACLL
jgi:hypothetical protein